jgi:hypothetical protein
MKLLIPANRERVVSPLPERERIKVRVLVERAILFARGSKFCLRRSSLVSSSPDDNRSIGILNRAPKNARWIRTLTFDPLPFRERRRLAERRNAAAS